MPAFASRLARHRAWVLAAAVLLGIVAGGGLRPAPAVIPEALGAPIEIRIAQKAADPKAADETEADEPAEKPKGAMARPSARKGPASASRSTTTPAACGSWAPAGRASSTRSSSSSTRRRGSPGSCSP
jgi:hypothetical protein